MADERSDKHERSKQVRDQYIAIAHMAKQIAHVYGQLAQCAESLPESVVGPKSAQLLEVLGDVMNGDDIVEKEDAWMEPIFEAAHRLYPHEGCAHCGRIASAGPLVDRDAIIEEVAKGVEAAPITYMGPDPGGIQDLRYLIIAAIRDMKNVSGAHRVVSHAEDINQCDGCRRGLEVRQNGVHYDAPFPKGAAVMACTRDRYTRSASGDTNG